MPPAKKVRPPPKPIVVASVERVTPRVIRIGFTGDNLSAFEQAKPGGHTKLLFAPPDAAWPPAPDAPRPPSRTYTPRRYDTAKSLLEVEFVLHGDGIASRWVESARVGDKMLVSGPGGGYPLPDGARHLVILADDTAMPAAAAILEALPADCRATIFCEIEDAAEERPLGPHDAGAPTWLHRAPAAATPGSLLEAAAAALPAQSGDTSYWVACEAGAMRRIRALLLRQGNVAPARLHTRGYWKLGNFNYPDHDYGND